MTARGELAMEERGRPRFKGQEAPELRTWEGKTEMVLRAERVEATADHIKILLQPGLVCPALVN